MSESSKIECEIIPLYRMVFMFDHDPDNDYERVLVADSLKGLIHGIVDLEMGLGKFDEGARKYLTITDFLLMPCDKSCKGYHLFDIDEHDCEQMGALHDEQWYDMFFRGNRPVPVEPTQDNDDLYEFFKERCGDEFRGVHEMEAFMADVVYAIAQKCGYRGDREMEKDENIRVCTEKTEEILLAIIENEGGDPL